MGKLSRPEYDEANRLDPNCGLNHKANYRAAYSHIPRERWEEIFGNGTIPDTRKGGTETVGGGDTTSSCPLQMDLEAYCNEAGC